jgi:gluconolactonase
MHSGGIKWVVSLFFCLFCDASISQTVYAVTRLTDNNLFTVNIEGPNVDEDGNLFVVNFQKNGTIGKVSADGSVSVYVTLPEGSTANSIMFDKLGNMLLADWTGHNILKVDKQTKIVSVFARANFNQPNDLTINSNGQLFASDPDWKNSKGKLWRIDPNGEVLLLDDKMGTTNGIELSPDQKTLYVNESVQRKIWSFKVLDDGSITNKKLFFEFDDFGLDGMKCDRNGNLYVTRHGKGTIAVLSPKGKMIEEVYVLGTKPSNLVFGGPQKKTLYITLQDCGCINVAKTKIAGREYRGK